MELFRGTKARVIIDSFLFTASVASMGFAIAAFSKASEFHRLLVGHLLPQYQYALEMERAAQKSQNAEFLQSRSNFLDSMEPDQSIEWIEAVSSVPSSLGFIQEQILPQINGRINQLQLQQKSSLDQVWLGFLAALLLSVAGFSGLTVAYWKQSAKQEEWENLYQAVTPPVHRLSMILQQLDSHSLALQEQTNQTVKQSTQLIELTEQLQKPLNQVGGVLGLVDDATEGTARNALETAERFKQTQEKLSSSLTVLRDLTERTERMRVLAEGLSDLADQANLFLVNSSIEIARQGEAGRGFSIVAEEVSHLADGSVKTSQELIQLIRQVNEEVAQKVVSLQQEVVSFAATHQVVARTDQSFTDLSRMVGHVCGQANIIQNGFQQLFLQTRSLKETTRELAGVQDKWQQWLAASKESVDQITVLLDEQRST